MVVLSALGLAAACGRPPPPPIAAAPGDDSIVEGSGKMAPASAARSSTGIVQAAYIEAQDPAAGPTAEELAAAPAPPGEPPEYTTVKGRALRGESSPRLFKELQRLGSKYPSYDEIPYLLGQLYFSKLWVGDGLKSFRRAIALNPAYRTHPYLLRSAVSGLGNDRDYGQVRAFLGRDIGAPAGPYLEEVIYGDYRQQVKDRAGSLLRELK